MKLYLPLEFFFHGRSFSIEDVFLQLTTHCYIYILDEIIRPRKSLFEQQQPLIQP